MLNKIITVVSVIIVFIIASCSKEQEESLYPNEITIGKVETSLSEDWLTNGDTFYLNIENIEYSISSKDIILSIIQIERNGKIIGSTKYTHDCTITVTVDNWSHGENELKIFAIFISSGKEIIKEIGSKKVFIFNNLPKYNIEGTAITVLKVNMPDGTIVDHPFRIESQNHIFKYGAFISVPQVDGTEKIYDRLMNVITRFHIDESGTNFDAEITNQEIHWRTLDGPSKLPENEELENNEILYGDFTIIGVYEGIKISKTTTIAFLFIKEK